jgi:hypothetical protein
MKDYKIIYFSYKFCLELVRYCKYKQLKKHIWYLLDFNDNAGGRPYHNPHHSGGHVLRQHVLRDGTIMEQYHTYFD